MKPLSMALAALLILASIVTPVRFWCLDGACPEVACLSDCCAETAAPSTVDVPDAVDQANDAGQERCCDCIPGVRLPAAITERSVDPPICAPVVESVIWLDVTSRCRSRSLVQRFPTGPPPPAALLRDQRCIRLLI